MIPKSKIRRLEITHPEKQWCVACDGSGIIYATNETIANCIDCKGLGINDKKKEQEEHE